MVTLKDIANKAGVHVGAVSYVLNDKPKAQTFRKETRERIIKIAKDLGYRRNVNAQFLRQGKTAAIGIFLPHQSNRLISDLVIGLANEANKRNFPINIFFGQDLECYIEFINKNKQEASTGIITYPYFLLDSAELISQEIAAYCKAGGKALLLNNYKMINLPDVPSVSIDDGKGAEIAAEVLLSKKCCKYLLCYRPEPGKHDGYIARRINAFSHVMKDAGVDFDLLKLSETDSYLKSNIKDKIGVFCLTDSCALQLVRKAENNAFKLGNNFLIIGFDDLYMTRMMEPGLSTIYQPFEEMGQVAMDKIINMINFGISEKNKILYPHFIERETT